ncbi:Histidine kinase [anaerobic digester metagenome]
MTFNSIKKRIPFNRLFRLVFGMALVLQLVVISYNHYSGYHELLNYNEFILRVLRGVFYSVIAGFLLAYLDLLTIEYLNRKFAWQTGVLERATTQFFLMLLIAVAVSSLLTSLAHWISSYRQGLQNVLLNNALIYCVVNAFFMSILEGWIFLDESLKEKARAEKYQQELIAEAANRVLYEAHLQIEEERIRFTQKIIEYEKQQNIELTEEIRKREVITKELNDSREQLSSILSNLAGAAFRCYFDKHYTVKYISDKIFEISGFHDNEFTSSNELTLLSIIHPDDKAAFTHNVLEAMLQKAHYEFECRIITKAGNTVWVGLNGTGVISKGEDQNYLDGFIIDISKRKEAERLARESERMYKDLMDLLPQPVFELNLNGELVLSNKAGDEFFGPLPTDPHKKQLALDCFIEEDRPRIIDNFKKSAKGIIVEPGEFTAIKRDGTLCPVMVFGNPIMRNGQIVGRRGIVIDISDRKKQELKLLEAKEELERINGSLEKIIAERTMQLTEANTQLLKVQKENLQSQFEVLKQQMNPHFLFNSLNVLSSLISRDVNKSQQFIDEFSHIYRYVLETIEKPVVTLNRELGFVRSYMFLQQIRYGENLNFNISIPSSILNLYMPPLSLQMVLENAIKHNVINEGNPLRIDIFSDNGWLVVRNNIQPKISMSKSTGLGQKNMVKRYALISSMIPTFSVVTNYYEVKLPLLNVDHDERIDN